MSGPVKKAAEATTKKIIPMASRAVTAAEAMAIAPNTVSQTETSMPWNGWFTSFLADKMGQERFNKLRRLVLYRPDDPNFMEQVAPPARTFAITDDGKTTAQYRTPAPGSRHETVRQPTADPGTTSEDPYDISYYTRDTARRYEDPAYPNPELERMKLALMDEDDFDVKEALQKLEERPASSRGNKGVFATGKTDFDPTGLRASMSATHEALDKSLDGNMPDHLPYPDWWDEQEEIVAWYKERDLPVPIGKTGHGTVPREGRIARW